MLTYNAIDARLAAFLSASTMLATIFTDLLTGRAGGCTIHATAVEYNKY